LGVQVIPSEESREAIIAYVHYPSPAFEAGLHVGDLVLTVNGLPIAQIERQNLNKLLTPTDTTQIVLEVSRLQKKMSFALTPVTYRAALASIGRKPTKFGTTPLKLSRLLTNGVFESISAGSRLYSLKIKKLLKSILIILVDTRGIQTARFAA